MNIQYSQINLSTLLIEIEKAVESIIINPILDRKSIVCLTNLGGKLLVLEQYYLTSKISYIYSSTIWVFRLALIAVNFNLTDYSGLYFRWDEFVATILENRHYIENEKIKYQQQEMKNKKALEEYLGDLLSHYSRLLFVRVDLFYLKKSQSEIDVVAFNSHMARLLARIGNKDTCFRDTQGYAWALEQGVGRGFHCHLLLIYDGAKHQKDYYLAEEVGKVWQAITNTKGFYFNCHTTEHKLSFINKGTLGIGMIHRDNPIEVQNAINTANYLVNPEKYDQHLRIKLPNMRTFGKGRYKVAWRRRINS